MKMTNLSKYAEASPFWARRFCYALVETSTIGTLEVEAAPNAIMREFGFDDSLETTRER